MTQGIAGQAKFGDTVRRVTNLHSSEILFGDTPIRVFTAD